MAHVSVWVRFPPRVPYLREKMFTGTNEQIIIAITNPHSLVWGNAAKEKIKTIVHNTQQKDDDYIVYNNYRFKISEIKEFLGIL